MRSSESQPERSPATARDNALSLIVSMADTTWRMFVSPAILVPAGLWADLRWHTRPWLTILGAVLGLVGSVLLVRAQLKEVA